MSQVTTVCYGATALLMAWAVSGFTTVLGGHETPRPVANQDMATAFRAGIATHAQGSGQVNVPLSVVHLSGADAFAKVLVWKDKVYAIRRAKPGNAEIHALDADVMFVLDGSATFVTGGAIVNPRETGDEIVGDAIMNGDERQLSAGDVVIVPKGVAHWFRNIDGAIRYVAVKVRP